ARAGSGFTLLFEAYVLALAKAMPIANAAKRLGEHDTRLWRIVEHYVWRAVEALDLSDVQRIAADETSARRGHDDISLFVDMARRKVVYVADGKDAANNAEITFDKFHVIKLANEAVDEVRRHGRYKQVIGDGLRFHKDERRGTEVRVAAHVLKRMSKLGRPISVRSAGGRRAMGLMRLFRRSMQQRRLRTKA